MSARALFLALAVAGLSAGPLFADTFTYTGNGNWSDPNNWKSQLVPPNDPATAVIFTPTGSGAITSTLDASRNSWQINSLTLNRSSNNSSSIATAPGSSLAFVGSNPFINAASAFATSISGNISSSSQLTLTGTSATSATTISADVNAPGLLITSGNFLLSGNNTLTDGVTVDASGFSGARLGIASSNALGDGPLNITLAKNGGNAYVQLTTGSGSSQTFSAPINVTAEAGTTAMARFTASSYANPYQFIFPSLSVAGPAKISFESNGVPSSVGMTFNAVALNGNATLEGNFTLSNVSGAGGLTVTNSAFAPKSAVILQTANSFTGGITTGGFTTLIANATGSLGAGPYQIGAASTLVLNASAAANSDIDASLATVQYNANGAAGGHLISAVGLSFGSAVTSLGGDTFNLAHTEYLSGNSTALALLTRNANITIGPGTQIENTDGVLPTINNLGTDADLILALHTTSPFNVNIGAGTPWGGIAGGRGGSYVGTVTALSNFSLSGGTLGDGSAGSFNILASTPVVVTGNGAVLKSPLSDYSGVASFDVTGNLLLQSANALGGGNGSSPVPLSVESAGNLTINNSQAINGNLTLHAGSILAINAPGLTGSGVISRDPGGVTFAIENAAAFSGSQLTPSIITSADTVILGVTDWAMLPSLNPAATYVVPMPFSTQSAGFNLNGGTLRLDENASLVAAPSGDNTIRIGNQGAMIQTQSLYSDLLLGRSANAVIDIPIVSSGPVTFGTLDPSATNFFASSSGIIALTTPSALPAATVSYGGLALASPSVLGTTPITLDHGFLELYPLAPAFPGRTAVYANSINVIGDSILSDATQSIVDSAFAQPTASTLAVGDIRLGAALQVNPRSVEVTMNSLTPTADATLSSNSLPITIGAIDADTSPHTLTFQGTRGISEFDVTGPTADTGPIVLDAAFLYLGGSVAASSNPIILTNGSSFASASPIDRPLVFKDAALGNYLPGPASTSDLTLSSDTTLEFALNSPGDSSDTSINVQGNLILDGSLSLQPGASFGPGDYTLFTYTGSLTDNGLDLPTDPSLVYALDTGTPGSVILHVAAVPEPACLAMLGLGGAVLLRRRARPTRPA
ncbi:MAG TPA: hypothetical protein VH253_07675 [Phycisphaerae bacterium]|nr:hypothetical protein [Phycisphaerae bacterium]